MLSCLAGHRRCDGLDAGAAAGRRHAADLDMDMDMDLDTETP